MIPEIFVALVHHPIVNKRGEVITTSVTNLDIHDIARTCRTFKVQKYFIVTPLQAQHVLIEKILGYWESDAANDYNPDRQDALSIVSLKNSVAEVLAEIEKISGATPMVATTAAKMVAAQGSSMDLAQQAFALKKNILLVFGTGWGLHESVIAMSDFRLNPITGQAVDGYNHLSVRSAAAIYTYELAQALATKANF